MLSASRSAQRSLPATLCGAYRRLFAAALFSLTLLALNACEQDRDYDSSARPPIGICKLVVEPIAVDFGTVQVGSTVTQTVTVANGGTDVCNVTQLALDPTTDSAFTISGARAVPFNLEPGETDPVVVAFAAQTRALPHLRQGALLVASNDPVTASQTIPLSADIDIGCSLSLSPDPLNFGNVALNLFLTTPITITNNGTRSCTIAALALAPGTDQDFTLAADQVTSATLAPTESISVPVTFEAANAPPDLKTGDLTFVSNDSSQLQVDIPLQGFVDTTCTARSQLIYTVDSSGMLASFDPIGLTYTDIAVLNCPTDSSTFSMAVDQSAIAWVEYQSGELFRVDTRDGSCTATGFQVDQLGFANFGMGFSFDPNAGTDTLYIAGGQQVLGPGGTLLGIINFPSLTVSSIGTVAIGWPELTGTGDGQLWGFVPAEGSATGVATVAQIDPATGNILRSFVYPQITGGGGWAMKFFGGSFWIFLGNSVYAVSRDTAALTVALDGTSPEVVGAGVSTCAPLH